MQGCTSLAGAEAAPTGSDGAGRSPRRIGGTTRARRRLRAGAITAASAVGATVLFASSALASPAVLTPGHAYCFYWAAQGVAGWNGTALNGGMHLVASSPSVIGAGPSNYISGTEGRPQDTVVYVDCLRGGQAAGYAYVGLPRVALTLASSGYSFAEHVVAKNIHRLESTIPGTLTVSVSLSGTVVSGAINGTLRLSAPGCLPKLLVLNYHGT